MRKISLKTRKIVAVAAVVAVLLTVVLLFILWPDTVVYAN